VIIHLAKLSIACVNGANYSTGNPHNQLLVL